MSKAGERLDAAKELRKSTFSIRIRLIVLAAIAIAPLLFDRVRAIEAERAVRIEAAQQQTPEWTRNHESDYLRHVDQAAWLAYAQLGAMTALVLLGIWAGGERMIVRPVHALTQAARRYGKGDLRDRLGDQAWAAEFAPLVRAMDDMATELTRREGELRHFNARLKKLAAVDGLTGLANRREFDARLKAEWRRASTRDCPLALLMIDVDHFKLFNDRHGHSKGDEVLRSVAAILAAAGRGRHDLAARFGGEEFALILPETDLKTAMNIAEGVRAAVESQGIRHGAAAADVITVSVGVAALTPGPGRPLPSLIEAADMALYGAKHRGRNRVVAAEGAGLARGSDRGARQPASTVDPSAAFMA
jgi:diguanylate cyclase (GGDEF)-like protein